MRRNEDEQQREYEGHITYAAGYITRYIEDYANRTQLPPNEFAIRLVSFIHATQSGQVRGVDDHVPALRRNSTEDNQTVREMAIYGRTHRKTQRKVGRPRNTGLPVTCQICNKTLSSRSKYMLHRNKEHPEAMKKQVQAMKKAKGSRKQVLSKKSSGVSKYWSTFSPEQRSKEIKRRQKVAMERKLAEVRQKAA